MTSTPSILVVLNPFEACHRAIDRAISLANQTGAKCDLVMFRNKAELSALNELDRRWQQQVEKKLEAEAMTNISQYLNRVNLNNLEFTISIKWCDRIVPAIIDWVTTYNHELIIKSPSQTHVNDSLIGAPSDWQLIQTCHCPIWIVQSKKRNHSAVIATLDSCLQNERTNHLNQKVLAFAKHYAVILGAQLHALHAVPPLPIDTDHQLVRIYEKEYLPSSKRRIKQSLKRLLSQFQIPNRRSHLIEDLPEQAVADYLKHCPNGLLVVGVSIRDKTRGALLGFTSEKILSRVTSDVLIVKTTHEPQLQPTPVP